VEELGGALCAFVGVERCAWCAMASLKVVLVISREVQWLLLLAADHGWLEPAGSSSGEALALFGSCKNSKCWIGLYLTAIYITC
jgi:hypothetical protein